MVQGLKTDWTKDDYYNFEDLNRVEEWTSVLNDKAQELFGEKLPLTIITDRNLTSIDTIDSINRIENNIAELWLLFNKPLGTEQPKMNWTYPSKFSFEDANRLERNLKHMNSYVQGNIESMVRCGDYIAGEGVVI